MWWICSLSRIRHTVSTPNLGEWSSGQVGDHEIQRRQRSICPISRAAQGCGAVYMPHIEARAGSRDSLCTPYRAPRKVAGRSHNPYERATRYSPFVFFGKKWKTIGDLWNNRLPFFVYFCSRKSSIVIIQEKWNTLHYQTVFRCRHWATVCFS